MTWQHLELYPSPNSECRLWLVIRRVTSSRRYVGGIHLSHINGDFCTFYSQSYGSLREVNPRTYERATAAQAIRQSTDNFEQPTQLPPPPPTAAQQMRTSFSEAPIAPSSGTIRINDIEKEALRIKHDDMKQKYEDLKNQFDRY